MSLFSTLVVITIYSISLTLSQPTTGIICPFLSETTLIHKNATTPSLSTYKTAVATLDIKAVFDDIRAMLNDSKACWPADTFNGEQSYGPLFIRLAWHCSGTYRNTDGLGGCAGGRQRFLPEADWEDNTNLDKARALLGPIKKKYGNALSWGDLFIFAGTASILEMGGPVTQVCAGRIDNMDGTLSEPLNNQSSCVNNTNCGKPNGASSVGLIYVNPEGVNGLPIPKNSAPRIRTIFSRMGMDDYETVALIGGGHAFGKSHGACHLTAGPGPEASPTNPWPGKCGANRIFTSGIEGAWTSTPLKWTNQYFTLLKNQGKKYIEHVGAGGKKQWYNPDNQDLIMMTTDLAFVYDDKYSVIVNKFANNITLLEQWFSSAWEKLVTNGNSNNWVDGNKNKKCVNASSLIDITTTTTTKEATESETETKIVMTPLTKTLNLVFGIAAIVCLVGMIGFFVIKKLCGGNKDQPMPQQSQQYDKL